MITDEVRDILISLERPMMPDDYMNRLNEVVRYINDPDAKSEGLKDKLTAKMWHIISSCTSYISGADVRLGLIAVDVRAATAISVPTALKMIEHADALSGDTNLGMNVYTSLVAGVKNHDEMIRLTESVTNRIATLPDLWSIHSVVGRLNFALGPSLYTEGEHRIGEYVDDLLDAADMVGVPQEWKLAAMKSALARLKTH